MTLGGIRCVKCYTRLTGTKWENDASLKGRVLRLSGDQWAATFVTAALKSRCTNWGFAFLQITIF